MIQIKRRQFIAYALLFTSGCTTDRTVNEIASRNNSVEIPKKLRFAVTDIQGLADLQRDYDNFRQQLEKVLELSVEFFPVDNFLAATPALMSNQVDLVFAGPSEYLILRARAKATPLVAVTRPDYYAVIAVKADSNIQSLADLKGKTIAMRTEGSTAGHIWPMKLLLDAGLRFKQDFQIQMMGDESLAALLRGEVDALADSNSRYDRFLKSAGVAKEQMSVIAQSQNLPSDVFVVSNALKPAIAQQIQKRMIDAQTQLLQPLASVPANRKYKYSKFIPAADQDYDEMRAVYRSIGQESIIL